MRRCFPVAQHACDRRRSPHPYSDAWGENAKCVIWLFVSPEQECLFFRGLPRLLPSAESSEGVERCEVVTNPWAGEPALPR